MNDLALGKALEESDYYGFAAVSSLVAAAAARNTRLPEAKRSRLVDRYATSAVDLLRRAVAKGYKNVDQLKSDNNLDALRKRPDFKQVLTELEAEHQKAK